MNNIWTALKENPVRIYWVVVAALSVVAAFGIDLNDLQRDAILGLAAAVLFGGEAVRQVVTPVSKLEPPVVPEEAL